MTASSPPASPLTITLALTGASGLPYGVRLLEHLLAAKDSEAQVAVSDSHKGSGHKIVELTTTLQEVQIAEILKAFSAENGVTVSAVE